MSKLFRVFTSVADLQEKPGDRSQIGRRDSQLLYGEEFLAETIANGWAYGRSLLDGYKGHVRLSDLRPDGEGERDESTHAVSTLIANAYPEPNFKTRPSLTLSFMARVLVGETPSENGFVKLKDGADLWIPESHLIALKDLKSNPADIVETAQMFSGAPYLYGGRSATGIDCSGLVQVALQRNGIDCPRDADQQQNVIGKKVSLRGIRRGDIVFFKGHVGIMVDDKNILNATVREMKTITEPLQDMLKHYGTAKKDAILAVRRPL